MKKPPPVDMTDDWMNPKPMGVFSPPPAPRPEDPMEYLIERQRRRICFGSPGSITEWDYWAKYDTAEKRDAAMAKLQEQHPMWRLRTRDRHPYWDRVRGRY